MTVLITLTTAGGSSGPFDLYSSNDGYTTPFETNVSKFDLIAGYESSLVPDYTVTVRVKSKGDCINYTDISLQHTTTTTSTSSSTTTTTTTISANCTNPVNYSSGEAYPTEINMNLGTDLGNVVLNYDAYSVPDRFIVKLDNIIVIDSGYRGDSYYDYGNGGRLAFIGSLVGKIDPVTGNTYPDFLTYPDDGYPRIVGLGAGSANFNKLNPNPTNAFIYVYGPMSNTAWELTMNCPTQITTTTTTTEAPSQLCYNYTVATYTSGGATYTDCNGVDQSVQVGGTSGYDSTSFCALDGTVQVQGNAFISDTLPCDETSTTTTSSSSSSSSTTTTTSSTSSTTTTTTTIAINSLYFTIGSSGYDACNSTTGQTLYWSGYGNPIGKQLYIDAGLTQLYTTTNYLANNNNVYSISNTFVVAEGTCNNYTTTTTTTTTAAPVTTTTTTAPTILATNSYWYIGQWEAADTIHKPEINSWVKYIDKYGVEQTKIIGGLENGCQEVIASSIVEIKGVKTCTPSEITTTTTTVAPLDCTYEGSISEVDVIKNTQECLSQLEFIVQYSNNRGPCPGGHFCNSATFYLRGNTTTIGTAYLDNDSGPNDKKNYPPSGTYSSSRDRYNVFTLTSQQAIDIAATSSNGTINFSLVCAYTSCHTNVTWITVNRNGQTLYSGCPNNNFLTMNVCTGEIINQ